MRGFNNVLNYGGDTGIRLGYNNVLNYGGDIAISFTVQHMLPDYKLIFLFTIL